MAGDDEYFNDTWKAFYHPPDDPDWTMASYKSLACVSSVRDYWSLHNAIEAHLADGMFFLMREHVFPCWDDKHNIEGGCVSVKVPREHAAREVALLMRRALGETLLRGPAADARWDQINGVSVSPKRAFCVVKVWLAGPELEDLELPRSRAGTPLYTPFRAHIQRTGAAPVQAPA